MQKMLVISFHKICLLRIAVIMKMMFRREGSFPAEPVRQLNAFGHFLIILRESLSVAFTPRRQKEKGEIHGSTPLHTRRTFSSSLLLKKHISRHIFCGVNSKSRRFLFLFIITYLAAEWDKWKQELDASSRDTTKPELLS